MPPLQRTGRRDRPLPQPPEHARPASAAFHGVGGIGKTWLLHRLRQIALEEDRQAACINLDRTLQGGAYLDDPNYTLFALREQIGGSRLLGESATPNGTNAYTATTGLGTHRQRASHLRPGSLCPPTSSLPGIPATILRDLPEPS